MNRPERAAAIAQEVGEINAVFFPAAMVVGVVTGFIVGWLTSSVLLGGALLVVAVAAQLKGRAKGLERARAADYAPIDYKPTVLLAWSVRRTQPLQTDRFRHFVAPPAAEWSLSCQQSCI